MKKTYYSFLSCLLIVVLMGNVSCGDDWEDVPKPRIYPENSTIAFGSKDHLWGNNDNGLWSIQIEDEAIVKVDSEKIACYLVPQKLGKTVATITNNATGEVLTSQIEVVKGETSYKIVHLSTNVEVIDTAYQRRIEDEIKANISIDTGFVYQLILDRRDGGELLLYPKGTEGEEVVKGSFTKDENDTYTFQYEDKEEALTIELWTPLSKSASTITLPAYDCLAKDYTSFFRKKYPDAGVYKAEELRFAETDW